MHPSALAATFVLLLVGLRATAEDLPPKMEEAWQIYVAAAEKQIVEGWAASKEFLPRHISSDSEAESCGREIHRGNVCTVKVETLQKGRLAIRVPHGMVHHWFGSIFVPEVSLDEVLRLIKDYSSYARHFDEVVEARELSRDEDADRFRVYIKLKRKKIITVYYNTEHEVTFEKRGQGRVMSRAVATRIREIAKPGVPNEKELGYGEGRGFLWRLNAYWMYEQVDGGVILNCEVLSLSRSIPAGLDWLVGPFVESIPRESLEATLSAIRRALTER